MNKISDTELKHLEGLTELGRPTLSGDMITDELLAHLCGLTSLEELNLPFTKVTDAGVEKLQTALPKCKIDH